MYQNINEAREHPHHHHHGGGRTRGRQRFDAPGGPGFDAPGGPAGPPFGPRGRGYGRRGRARRGDVRAAMLSLLASGPMNGYQIIQQISERSGGMRHPSPGSVYPALAQLEDEGLIAPAGADAPRRGYELTEAGHAYVTEHADELEASWSALTSDGTAAATDIRTLLRQVQLAAFGVVTSGTDAQVSEARAVLAGARRSLYLIMADDPSADNASDRQQSTDENSAA